jgi:hypothetical protein
MKFFNALCHLYLVLILTSCASLVPVSSPPTATPSPSPVPAESTLGAGFRFSTYGPSRNPGAEYWASVGERMSAKFSTSHPETIWIVGNFMGDGMTYLSFLAKTDDPNIRSGYVDMNEAALSLFDQKGFKVWLQVEPGDADVSELIKLVMIQYKNHPSVIGFGIDVEWYKSDGSAEGTPVTDTEAETWVKTIHAINPNYKIFLKHWDQNWMPPTYRDGIVFVDDSQQFQSFDQLVNEFSEWGKYFAPSPVAFQYGYPDDKKWWQKLQDPAGDIGKAILAKTPNTASLFWVDFTVLEVFPPQ